MGMSAVVLFLSGHFTSAVMAPDLGTKRTSSEFGKLCYDAILAEQ